MKVVLQKVKAHTVFGWLCNTDRSTTLTFILLDYESFNLSHLEDVTYGLTKRKFILRSCGSSVYSVM